MKVKLFFIVGATLLLITFVAFPALKRWRENQRRVHAQSSLSRVLNYPLGVPQSQRKLERPSAQQLKAAFTNDVLNVLQNADRFVLYSIEPRIRRDNITRWFHDRPLLGQVEFITTAQKQKLRDSFLDGVAESSLSYVQCFEPRHGLRAIKDKKTVDFVICFECKSFETYINQRKMERRPSSVGNAPAATFNEMLTQANVPLSQW